MLSADALTTLETVKSELAIPAEDTSRDAVLARLINAASDAIRQYCRRDFARRELTEELKGAGTRTLLLSHSPIVAVASVTMDGRVVGAEEYVLERDSGILVLKCGVWRDCGYPNIVVAYTGGYVTPHQAASGSGETRDLPYDIEQACVITAATQFRHLGQPADVRSIWVEQLRVEFAEGGRPGLPPVAVSLLEPYVRWA